MLINMILIILGAIVSFLVFSMFMYIVDMITGKSWQKLRIEDRQLRKARGKERWYDKYLPK